MKITEKILKAYTFAKNAHEGQVRKYTFVPYFNHCVDVMLTLQKVTDDENMLCAALLHDVVEDTEWTIDEICNYFGYEIARLVDGLTDISVPEDGNRAKRKEIDRNHLALGCEKVQTIKLADLINNSVDIIENDPKFAKVYIAEKELLMKVLDKGNIILYTIANEIIEDYFKQNN